MLKRKTWNLYAVYTVIFCKIVLHVNSVVSRYIFDTVKNGSKLLILFSLACQWTGQTLCGLCMRSWSGTYSYWLTN